MLFNQETPPNEINNEIARIIQEEPVNWATETDLAINLMLEATKHSGAMFSGALFIDWDRGSIGWHFGAKIFHRDEEQGGWDMATTPAMAICLVLLETNVLWYIRNAKE